MEAEGADGTVAPAREDPAGAVAGRGGRWRRASGSSGTSSRTPSARTRLLRAGLADVARAAGLLVDPALVPYLPPAPAGEEISSFSREREKGAGGRVPPGEAPGAASLPGIDARHEPLLEALAEVADPDLALLSLARLAQACTRAAQDGRHDDPTGLSGPGRPGTPSSGDGSAAQVLAEILRQPGEEGASGTRPAEAVREHQRRLLAVLGHSQALGDFLVAHPEKIAALAPERAWGAAGAPGARQLLHQAVAGALADEHGRHEEGARDAASRGRGVVMATAALRRAYRELLLTIVADDLVSPEPVEHVAVVGARMAELADATLEAGLAVARAAVGPAANQVGFAVIAMGKTGAGELNYVSDVDVVYVVGAPLAPASGQAGPGPGEPEEERLVEVGTQIATELARVVSASGAEPPLWPLDTALRPEGKDGALVRTLASHLAYYERWAASWEFQALLKARFSAGDPHLGTAYVKALSPLVWEASRRDNFVEDTRAMRRRVERESGPQGEEDRRIKLGPGGLRDVEFTVQLLQLVHARSDPSLRVRGTLEALDALGAGGYVGRQDAAAMSDCYKALRLLEHRSQLYRLRRTHDLPAREEDLRRIGRGLHRSMADAESLSAVFRELRRRVRALHEEIYYRPLLGAAAPLSADEMALSPQAARERLAAFGYVDAEGALHHIHALTEGVSRRAAIQRQLLPVIIGWIGQGADPDFGLLSFRKLSETVGGSHWYLAMLRDSPVAAQRLCHVLSSARWVSERLGELPEAIAWLDDDSELLPRSRDALAEEVASVLRRRWLSSPDEAGLEAQAVEAVQAVVRVRAREEVRAALADCLDAISPQRGATILTDAMDVTLGGALCVATGLVVALREGVSAVAGGPTSSMRWEAALADHAVIAMGRLGGSEVGYASDADVLFVYRARPGADEAQAAQEADVVARWTVRLLAAARPHALEVDTALRPEGRQGPMSRSLDSYTDYYGRWSAVWERQALLRARACAGDARLGGDFEAMIAPLRWVDSGLGSEDLREIRRVKARMETERLPRGVDPARHLKLGPGGLSDVEWSAQVLQLAHAGTVEGLRTTSTLGAIQAAALADLLGAEDAGRLAEAWILASRLRAAIVLGTGRTSGPRREVLPDAVREIRLVGRLIGLDSGRERELEDLYRRSARHARAVAERVVFGGASGSVGASAVPAEAAPVTPQGPYGARGGRAARSAGVTGDSGLRSGQHPKDAVRPSARSGTASLPLEVGPRGGADQQPGGDEPPQRQRRSGLRRGRDRRPGRGRAGEGPYPWS